VPVRAAWSKRLPCTVSAGARSERQCVLGTAVCAPQPRMERRVAVPGAPACLLHRSVAWFTSQRQVYNHVLASGACAAGRISGTLARARAGSGHVDVDLCGAPFCADPVRGPRLRQGAQRVGRRAHDELPGFAAATVRPCATCTAAADEIVRTEELGHGGF